ncbi:MAG: hypothetical protein A2015_08665 [Spirochaetes bacterium GWF1_31_7]|nr:MAG: hypothetical protein A2Y30_06995 [Spirochaetes bacterium GWE1_32_154]OHD47995.1 MAG: hypothetical protein A2015_08665 [Spirochaetes bacterium GWF1_31_7]OHD48086.1 MAG: hypothetical protein A2Y29_08000 [Spirochaetes bacterium GWE2_31_10]OHD79964.1 MAG: hypothetical protein A2355_00085 [Spirochaetes bacterium RIFOXYB1_FULL_32_8]HBD92794.1 hypothetical protein [Spirochaetia bacterium]
MNINSKVRYISAGLLIKDRKVLVALRKEKLWEFPGGKLESDENNESALIREFQEEMSIAVKPVEEVASVEIDNNDNSVDIFIFILVTGDPAGIQLKVHSEYKFVSIDELRNLELCVPDKILINDNVEALKKYID